MTWGGLFDWGEARTDDEVIAPSEIPNTSAGTPSSRRNGVAPIGPSIARMRLIVGRDRKRMREDCDADPCIGLPPYG